MRIFNKGFNFGQDGPGNRLVYHLQGCNMRCIWCSNPEGINFLGGKEFDVKDIFEECVRSRLMFFSGGGVTFTGGEATMQHDELLMLLKLLKAEGINTCIETNGTSKKLFELLEYVDYLITDFKHFDTRELERYTGVGCESIKENFELLCKTKRQAHIRIPLINGINTQNPRGFSEYFSQFDTENIVFEFLAYHEYGKEKWTEEYKVKDGFVTKEIIENFKKAFKEKGLKLITT